MAEPQRACLISGRQAVGPFSSHATAGPRRLATRSEARPPRRAAGRAFGSQPPGSLETTGKPPQFLRDTQSEPYVCCPEATGSGATWRWPGWGVLGDDARVRIVRADLAGPAWARALPAGAYDAVLTANSLHWLPERALRRVYTDLADLIRPGGMACNADVIPADGADRLMETLELWAHQVQPALPEGELDWEGWWRAAAADPSWYRWSPSGTSGPVARYTRRSSVRRWPGTPPRCEKRASPKLVACGATVSGLSWPPCDEAAKRGPGKRSRADQEASLRVWRCSVGLSGGAMPGPAIIRISAGGRTNPADQAR
jgi:hypothetical protein